MTIAEVPVAVMTHPMDNEVLLPAQLFPIGQVVDLEIQPLVVLKSLS